MKTALIIGGGIGGLAAGVALRRIGYQVRVCERAGEWREVGAGLLLAPNALKALQYLDLSAAVEAAGIPLERAEIRTRRGDLLTAMPAGAIGKRVGAPTVCLHRADLLALLAGALDPEVLRLGRECTGVEQEGTRVTARFAGGPEEQGDFLIGADGLRSVVREHVPGMKPLRYAGYTAWRGIAACERPGFAAATACETWGCGLRFGFVPTDRRRVYWYATMNAPEGAHDPEGRRKQELLKRFARWHDPIPTLIEATEEATILRNDVYDREPARQWGQGRITLLGDAAHPTTPNLGQGACQALEDAVVLARCLAAGADTPAALRAYEAERMPRTRRIVQQSRRIGSIGQWENPWACGLRDLLTRMTPTRFIMRQTEWVVRYQP
jgi:2-polyprenyl-6-methoxyphenol hydroxylase-like FAD-dependent oxidoreductase